MLLQGLKLLQGNTREALKHKHGYRLSAQDSDDSINPNNRKKGGTIFLERTLQQKNN